MEANEDVIPSTHPSSPLKQLGFISPEAVEENRWPQFSSVENRIFFEAQAAFGGAAVA